MIPQYTKRKEEMKNINILKQTDIKYFTPNNASNYEGYGNCYYYKIGSRVHLHVGVTISSTSNITIGILPEQYRPITVVGTVGLGSDMSTFSTMQVSQNGGINISSSSGYALIDVEYDTLN